MRSKVLPYCGLLSREKNDIEIFFGRSRLYVESSGRSKLRFPILRRDYSGPFIRLCITTEIGRRFTLVSMVSRESLLA